MYTLSNKLRLFSFSLMIIGAIGLLAGFMTTPGSVAEVKEMMAKHDSHGGGHGQTESASHSGSHDANDHHGDKHYEHVLGQLQNKPWASLYIAAFFFFMIALGVLAFYAIQFAAQAGWSPVLFRVMEAITAYLVPGGIILFVILMLSGFHMNHLFHWMDPEMIDPSSEKYDALIDGKKGWLNVPWFLIRAALFLGGWFFYRHLAVKFSRKQDEEPAGNKWYKKSFKWSAGFLVFFI